MARIAIINGPNLNLLGTREPEIYGTETLADVEARCTAACESLGHEALCRQSNSEGDIIDWIQAARDDHDAIVINPGGYTHTSVAIRDALAVFDGPIAEIHISNPHARESFRHTSLISGVADSVICGCGFAGYEFAIAAVAAKL